MTTPSPSQVAGSDIAAVNRQFYDRLWRTTRLQQPERFNTWPMISSLAAGAARRLEIGPGMRPRLPIAGTHFVDLSAPAVAKLNALGGVASEGSAALLPFPDKSFDLVCAFDVVEHVADDAQVFAEIDRVLSDNGTLFLSVPLFASHWTPFDAVCGHYRRYEPDALHDHLARRRLRVVSSAAYGMQPKPWLVNLGMWFFTYMPRRAMFFYNYVAMPIGMRMQPELAFVDGMLDTRDGTDEVVVICRRSAPGT